MPGQQAAAEEAAHVGRVGRAGVPVGHALPADGDLARVGVLAALDALGVGLAGRHRRAARPTAATTRPRAPTGRGAGRRSTAACARAARGPRAGRAPRPSRSAPPRPPCRPARGRRAARPVDRARRALVGAERLLVVGLGLLGGAGHLDVEVERADLLAELDDVGAHGVAHLLELGGLLAAAAALRARPASPPPPSASAPSTISVPEPGAAAPAARPRRPGRRPRAPRPCGRRSRAGSPTGPRRAWPSSAASAASGVAPSGSSRVLPARNRRPTTTA